jgi:predicted secreted Zn-dependent protease
LEDDEVTFYLEPIFEPKYAGYQNRIPEKLEISVSYKQMNYPVDGSSFNSWSADVQSDANPISLRTPEGNKYMGLSSWNNMGHYWYIYEDGSCRMTRYKKDYTATTTLPAPSFPSGYESTEANEYYWDIVFHEGAHNRINRWKHERRLEMLIPLFEPFYSSSVTDVDSCGEALLSKLRKTHSSTAQQYEAESEELHSIDGGAYWGRCEQPNRFMDAYCPTGM